MTTQVSFTTDQNLKKQALRKAKREGITLKAVLVYAMKGFVEGKVSLHLGTHPEREPEVEEVFFTDKKIYQKAAKIAALLK